MTKSKISSIAGVSGFSRPLSFRLFNGVGITAAIGLAALPAFLTFSPLTSSGANNVHAETTETLGTSASITSTLGLSANSISMNVSPSSNGAVFKTGKTIATVSTNNETGYTLYFSDSDGDNALNHANLTDAAIASTTSALTGASMLTNTWGYTLGDSETEGVDEVDNDTNLALTYLPIPTERIAIRKTDAAVSTELTTVTFGVKIDTAIPSGIYSDQVSITAVPNYNSAAYAEKTLWINSEGIQITKMQEMTHDICASVPTPLAFVGGRVNTETPEITLVDERDGETYVVRKLADGNCWMDQNLNLAKEKIINPSSKLLTPELTDMKEGTFDLGDSQALGTKPSPSAPFVYDSNDAEWYKNSIELTTETPMVKRYARGNYYNEYARGLNPARQASLPYDYDQTLCPKGWTLPSASGSSFPPSSEVDMNSRITNYSKPGSSTTGFDSSDSYTYSFYNLSRVYGLALMWSTWTVEDVVKDDQLESKNRMSKVISATRSGYYSPGGAMTVSGSHFMTASGSRNTNWNAPIFAIYTSGVRLHNTVGLSDALPVRCVAR